MVLLIRAKVALGLWQRVEETSVDGVLAAEFIRGVDRDPLLGLQQVKHLDLADVRGASKLEQVAVMHDDESWCASSVIERGEE